MTMHHEIHPDDERLAALAGGDPEVAGDTELSAHVSGCSRCNSLVDELTTLRSALAELPDLVPSRRLQLIPPVAEPRAAASGGFLRRLAAPVMAAGFGLVLVGAVGTSGILSSFAPAATGSADRLQNVGGELASPSDSDAEPGMEATDGRSLYGASPIVPDSVTLNSTPSTPRRPAAATTERPEESVSELGAARDDSGGLFSVTDPRLPWLVVLGLGVGLLLAGLYLRFNAQPRAG